MRSGHSLRTLKNLRVLAKLHSKMSDCVNHLEMKNLVKEGFCTGLFSLQQIQKYKYFADDPRKLEIADRFSLEVCASLSVFYCFVADLVEQSVNRVQNVNRESTLEPSASDNEERIPFTLTFHPNNLAARNVVLRNFKILQSDPETAPIFPNPPLVLFKRDRNLRNSLVRSSLPSNLEPGTFNCSRKVCNTCPFINSKTHIRGPNGSYQVNDHFDCTTSNIIYCITCTLCNKLYIGESGRKLGDRFREHLLDVKNKGSDLSKPVARHFNLPGHSHEHMEICGIYLHLGNNETRKRKEQRLIFKLGTLAPNGINERFSFA